MVQQPKVLRMTSWMACLAVLISAPGSPSWIAAQASQSGGAPPNSVTLVLPADADAGSTISGSVGGDYSEIPGLSVAFIPVSQPAQTKPSSGSDASTAEFTGDVDEIDVGDGKRQPINGSIIIHLASGASSFVARLYSKKHPGTPVGEKIVTINTHVPRTPKVPTDHPMQPSDYTMPSFTTPGGIEVIHGPTSGNASEMRAAMNGRPLRIVAATKDSTYITMEDSLPGGTGGQIEFVPAPNAPKVVLNVAVPSIALDAKRNMMTHEQEELAITVKVPPQTNWAYGTPSPSLVSMEKLKRRNGFEEPKPSDRGSFVVIAENRSDAIQLGQNNVVSFVIHERDLQNGSVTRSFRIKAKHKGVFQIVAHVYPYLADSVGQVGNEPSANIPANNSDDKTNEADGPQPAQPADEHKTTAEKKGAGPSKTPSAKPSDKSFDGFMAWLQGALSKDQVFQALRGSDAFLDTKIRTWEEAKAQKVKADQALQRAIRNQKALDEKANTAEVNRLVAKNAADTSRALANLKMSDQNADAQAKQDANTKADKDEATLHMVEADAQQGAAAAKQAAKAATEASKAVHEADKVLTEAAKQVNPEIQKTVERIEASAPQSAPQERVEEAQSKGTPR